MTLSGPLAPADELVGGFRRSEATVLLGDDEATWQLASRELLRWGVKTRSGFSVRPGSGSMPGAPVSAGQRYWLVAHLGPLRIREPVEVVAVVDEADRKGFAYGTLEGHPVSGEESFIVERRPDGAISFTNRALTAPPPGWWRLLYPAALLAQPRYQRRYRRAFRA